MVSCIYATFSITTISPLYIMISCKHYTWGAWVAQWVKASAFGSGHDLRVLGSSPTSGSLLSREPASSSLSLPLCILVFCICQINK